MEESPGKSLIRKQSNSENIPASQSMPYKRTKFNKSQNMQSSSALDLSRHTLLSQPALTAAPRTNRFAVTGGVKIQEKLEDSDLGSELVIGFAKIQV